MTVGIDQVHTQESNTMKMALHETCGYAYLIIDPDGKPAKPICVDRGPNAVSHFLNTLIREEEELAIY